MFGASLDIYANGLDKLKRPQGARQWPNPGPLHIYVEAMAVLGLDDPCEVQTGLDRHRELRQARKTDQTPGPRTTFVQRLAAGDVDPDEDLAEDLTQALDPDAQKRARDVKAKALDAAADLTLRDAYTRLVDYGPTLITQVLRPIVADAVQGPLTVESAAIWHDAHELANGLRKAHLLTSCQATPTEHAFARPDLVHRYQLDHAHSIRQVASAEYPAPTETGVLHLVLREPVDPPELTLQTIQAHPEWKAGIYTADEVIGHADTFAPTLDQIAKKTIDDLKAGV